MDSGQGTVNWGKKNSCERTPALAALGSPSLSGKEYERILRPCLGKKIQTSHISSTTSLILQASIALNFAFVSIILALLSPSKTFSGLKHTPLRRLNEYESGYHHCNRFGNFAICLPPGASPRLSASAIEHLQLCSGNGHFVVGNPQEQRLSQRGACHCHSCFSGPQCDHLDPNCVLNLFHGDPTMFELYWLAQPHAATVIPGWQGMSYFAHKHNSYLFVDHHLEQAIRGIHKLVGNAVTEGRYVVLGVGSTQLYQAALYALSSTDSRTPTSVISAIPYYSSYQGLTTFYDSRKFKWAGDAYKFQQNSEKEPYIEIVTSPNNPCGSIREAVVNGSGPVVHDLAYYWPNYTPITSAASGPLTLWTLSKITGHAGTRLGWAIVEDEAVAAKMAYFIQLNTLGVSQDAQARATTLLQTVMSTYTKPQSKHPRYGPTVDAERQPFFHYAQAVMEERWKKMRQALDGSTRFSIQEYNSSFCSFLEKNFKTTPAFLWLRCTEDDDCAKLLRDHKIVAREGPSFGVSAQYVRVSMLDRDPLFDLLLTRLASIRWDQSSGTLKSNLARHVPTESIF